MQAIRANVRSTSINTNRRPVQMTRQTKYVVAKVRI